MPPDAPLPEVDWSDTSRRQGSLTTVLAAIGLVAIAATFAYDYYLVPAGEPVLGYEVSRLDWLWLVSLWLTAVYLVVPAVKRPAAAVALLRRFREHPVGAVAGVFTMGVFLAGTVGPLVLAQPEPHFLRTNQPPVYTTIDMVHLVHCENRVGTTCHGTWRHPLGTTASGKDVLKMLVFGARVVVKLSMVSVMLIIPVATLVGTVSAYLGGGVDRVLTSLTEGLKTIPAILVFLAWRLINAIGGSGEASLFMLVVTFGLFSWGSVADIVRSRALNEVSKNYVKSAEASGASTAEVVRWHLIPNVSRTAFSTAVLQVPLFIIYEATLLFIRISRGPSAESLLLLDTDVEAWGRMMGANIRAFDPFWWRSVMPAAALLMTIVCITAFANAIQDVVDPRAE